MSSPFSAIACLRSVHPTRAICAAAVNLLLTAAVAVAAEPATGPALDPDAPRPYLLHLPGIGGKRAIDRMLVGGLTEGGVAAHVEIYDWTCNDPGLNALFARQRNAEQATLIAKMIERRFRLHPGQPIYLTGHSGGAGLLAFALEQLPEDVIVEDVLLLAPALSPRYDLSRALRHVRGQAYVLYSPHDPVLGAGTKWFGTIDGVKSEAAGKVGFTRPHAAADPMQYDKLVSMPYDSDWLRYRNIGDHIGPMMRPFAKAVLAPLLTAADPIGAALAARAPTTVPATRPVSR